MGHAGARDGFQGGVLRVQVLSCVSLRQWPLEHLVSALLR